MEQCHLLVKKPCSRKHMMKAVLYILHKTVNGEEKDSGSVEKIYISNRSCFGTILWLRQPVTLRVLAHEPLLVAGNSA